jgi:hypothetical protein
MRLKDKTFCAKYISREKNKVKEVFLNQWTY